MISAAIFVLLCPIADCLSADEPPSNSASNEVIQQIDYWIRQGWNVSGLEPAKPCSDREFVRRVYLDLVGRVPSLAELETFLADGRSDRRAALVDLLLASEDYVQHFTDLLDALLMGRSDEGHYQQRVQHGWRAYLEDAFRSNRPWNEVAAEILSARPTNPDKQGAVWYLYERNNQHQSIAEAVAPTFFGLRIECAQCHDHMLADEIKQAHYWGLVAFFNRGKNVNTPAGPRVSESAIGGFAEFANLNGQSSPNRLSFVGAADIEEIRPGQDEKQEDLDDLYRPAELDGEPRIPNFSRRQRFVDDVLKRHPLLARAMVNRLWAIMLGRGIVHPYDEMDSVHEASHPELLGWLSADFSANRYDIRRLLRSLALSEAYQLASTQPVGVDDPASFAWYLERPLTAEQMARSVQLVARASFKNDDELVKQFRQQFKEVLPDETIVGVGDTLFFSNGPALDNFISSSTGEEHLVSKLMHMESTSQRLEHLFLVVFGRTPVDVETEVLVEYLEKRGDATEDALRQVLWSLVTSAEFQFNH